MLGGFFVKLKFDNPESGYGGTSKAGLFKDAQERI